MSLKKRKKRREHKKASDMFHQLCILWALHMLGGEAGEEDLKYTAGKIADLVRDKDWSVAILAGVMIDHGFPQDRLTGFFESHGFYPTIKERTVH